MQFIKAKGCLPFSEVLENSGALDEWKPGRRGEVTRQQQQHWVSGMRSLLMARKETPSLEIHPPTLAPKLLLSCANPSWPLKAPSPVATLSQDVFKDDSLESMQCGKDERRFCIWFNKA